MAWYKYSRKDGIVDVETGRQAARIVSCNATKKWIDMASKELVNKLNSIEQAKRVTPSVTPQGEGIDHAR